MRSFVLVLLAAGCADAPRSEEAAAPDLESTSEGRLITVGAFDTPGSLGGVSISDDGAVGHVTMNGATCAFPATSFGGTTTYDGDVAEDDDEDVDDGMTHHGVRTVLARGLDGLYLVSERHPGSRGTQIETVSLTDVSAARMVDAGIVAVRWGDAGCEVRWVDAEGEAAAPLPRCDVDAMVVDRGTGTAFAAIEGEVWALPWRDRPVSLGVSGDRIAWDAGSGALVVATTGRHGLAGYAADGRPLWAADTELDVEDVAAIGASGAVAVLERSVDEGALGVREPGTGLVIDRMGASHLADRLAGSHVAPVVAVVGSGGIDILELR